MIPNSENKINKLFKAKIEQFKQAFINTSRDVYTNEDGNLLHPSEFGINREEIVKNYLKNILPDRMEIGSGFVGHGRWIINIRIRR